MALKEIIENKPNTFVFVFQRKKDRINHLTDQDKKHMRIFAVLEMIKQKTLDVVINTEFDEKFKFNEEEQTAIYIITLKKVRKKNYADC